MSLDLAASSFTMHQLCDWLLLFWEAVMDPLRGVAGGQVHADGAVGDGGWWWTMVADRWWRWTVISGRARRLANVEEGCLQRCSAASVDGDGSNYICRRRFLFHLS